MEELLNKSAEEFNKLNIVMLPPTGDVITAWHKSQMELAYKKGYEDGKWN